MRRVGLLVFLMAMASVVFTGLASAQTSHFNNNSRGAFGVWDGTASYGALPYLYTQVNASQSARDGKSVHVSQTAYDFPVTRSVQIEGGGSTKAGDDVSLRIARDLSGAHVSGSDLPATRCVYVDQVETGCTDITIDVDVTWTGQGAIERYVQGGLGIHTNYLRRDAVASGSAAGQALPLSEFSYGGLFVSNFGF